MVWTISQRRALIALVGMAALALGVKAYRMPAYVGADQPEIGPRAGELDNRLDPNTASAAELSNLPDLGRVRAAAIISYREHFAESHAGLAAFARPEDLRHVKGIGPATLEKITPYLNFASVAPPGR